MRPSNIKRVATTTFLAAPMVMIGCIESNIGVDVPSWDNPAPRPIDEVVQHDEIKQVTSPKVDVLWMIDNSCSMFEEQEDLSENFPLFMDFFLGSGLDYHVGVTSSDLDGNYNGADGKLVVQSGVKYLDPDIANPIDLFSQMATLGTGGSGTEQGTGAVFKALEVEIDRANEGFWRDDAALHTVIISDEPDLTRAAAENVPTQPEFIGWYGQLKDSPDDRTFSSIVDPNIGGAYRTVTNSIGGIYWSILDQDWPQVLEQLGVQAAGLKREYYLSRLPVVDSIEVYIVDGGATIDFVRGETDPETGLFTGDYEYDPDRNSIVFFEYVPNVLSTINITYTVLASQQSFEE